MHQSKEKVPLLAESHRTTCGDVTTIIWACWALVLACGVCWGFPSLLPLLGKRGIYADLCEEFVDDDATIHAPSPGEPDNISCEKQLLALNKIFLLTSAAVNSLTVLNGLASDNVPRRALLMATGGILACTSLALSFEEEIRGVVPWLDVYVGTFVLLGVFGNQLFYCMLTFIREPRFQRLSWLLLPAFTVMWDISSLVFFVFSLADVLFGASLGQIWLIYTALLVISIFPLVFAMRPLPIYESTETTAPSPSVWERAGVLATALNQPAALALLGFNFLAQNLNTFYMGTIFEQMKHLFPDDQAALLAQIFALSLPCVAIPSFFALCWLHKRSPELWFASSTVCFAVQGVISVTPVFELQVVAFILFSFNRMNLYAGVFAYCRVMFDSSMAASVAAFCLTVAGLASFSLPTLNAFVAEGKLWFEVNTIWFSVMTVASCVMTATARWRTDAKTSFHSDVDMDPGGEQDTAPLV